MKSVKILSLAFGLILLASAAAFAQLPGTSMTTTFANIPVAPNAQTGLVGELDFTPLVSGTIPAGESLTVTYGAPISSISDIQIFVVGCNGNAAIPLNQATPTNCASGATVSATVNTKPAGNIVLSFAGTAPVPTAPLTQLIRITGVRVDVNSLSAAPGAVINATVTNSTGLGSITNNFVPVATVTEPIAISILTGKFSAVPVNGGVDSTGSLVISELFTNAFETKGASSPTQILVTIPTIPAGFTFNSTAFGSTYVGTEWASSTGAHFTITNVTATGFQVNIISQNSQSLDKIDIVSTGTPATLALPFTPTAPVAPTPGSITVAATLAPPASGAAPYTVSATTANKPLLYASRLVSVTAPIGATSFSTTTLYSVFNVSGNGFETGFAVANPTGITDQVNAPNKLFGAAAQAGSIKVVLVPADGSATQTLVTSDASLGMGLDANGFLPAGKTWNVLLSAIIAKLPTPLATFQGQVFFYTNFNNAHGVNFIADPLFAVQSQGYPMLVLSATGNNN